MSFTLQDQALQVTGLKSTEQLVLIQLSKFANNKTFECWPSVATICKNLNKSRRTVQRCIAQLEKLGIIRRLFRTGTSNLFKLFFTKPELPLLGSEHDAGGAPSVTQGGAPPMTPKSISINQSMNKKQAKPVCVQELALNETALTLQGFLDMFKWDKGQGYRIKKAWKRLNEADKQAIKELLPQYINDTCWKSEGIYGKTYRCNPAKWLNDRRWTEIKPKSEPYRNIRYGSREPKTVDIGPDKESMAKAKEYLDCNYEQVKQRFLDTCPEYQRNMIDYFSKSTVDMWLIDLIFEANLH